jgi:hypothetical protein
LTESRVSHDYLSQDFNIFTTFNRGRGIDQLESTLLEIGGDRVVTLRGKPGLEAVQFQCARTVSPTPTSELA